MRRFAIVLLLFTLAAGAALAQVQIDKRRPASPKGEIGVNSAFGSIEIVGWDHNEVAITGTLAAGVEGLSFDGDKESVWIGVDEPDAWFYSSDDDSDFRSTLTIQVPAGSSVGVESVNASITISGIVGSIDVESVNGSVRVSGRPAQVDVEAMTGAVEIRAGGAPMEVDTVSGSVTLIGAARSAEVTTVSGAITVSGSRFQDVELKSTSGDVRFDGSLVGEEGRFECETFSGNITLTLPRDVKAQFELVTFTGAIRSELGPRSSTEGRFNPYQKLRFSTGLEEFDVTAKTYEGDIAVGLRDGTEGN